MKAAFLKEPGKIYVTDIPVPRCGDDQVLIKIKEVGICGSDIHYYKKGRIGDHIIKEPFVLGHESSGVVCETGKNVKGFKLNEDFVSRKFKQAVRKAKLDEGIHFHTLRHSFASNLVQKGVSLYVVKELLGHESITTTQIYSHLQKKNLRDAIDLL